MIPVWAQWIMLVAIIYNTIALAVIYRTVKDANDFLVIISQKR